MSSLGIMILILVIFVGIPGVSLSIYLFRCFIHENWFRNLLIRGTINIFLLIGTLLCAISISVMWCYWHAESDYLTLQLDKVTGTLTDVEYCNASKGGYHYRVVLDNRNLYKLQDFPSILNFDIEEWFDSALNQKITLEVEKYGWIRGKFNSLVLDEYGRCSGKIYGIIDSSGQIILNQERVCSSYYDHFHDNDSLRDSFIMIAVGAIMLLVAAWIKHKSRRPWKELL